MNLEKIAQGFVEEGYIVVPDIDDEKGIDYRVSGNLPLLSRGYFFCRALILSDGRNTALAHILPKSNVKRFISQMSTDLARKPKELKAAIVEVDYPYEQDLEIFCRDAGINVAQTHRLEFSNETFKSELEFQKAENNLERNVAVDPRSQRVCIYQVPFNKYLWMQL